jgi:hypothetical protein
MTESLKVTACVIHDRISEIWVQQLREERWTWGPKIHDKPCLDLPDDPAEWLASLSDLLDPPCELVTHRLLIPEMDDR